MNEHAKFRAEQEIKKEAELKAKLEMVTARPRRGGAQPRKIGVMVCDTGVKNGYCSVNRSFVLRLDAHSGEFIAECGDVFYVSKSRDALKAKMDEVARVTLDLKWTRYLVVEYRAIVPYDNSWHANSGTTTLGIDAARRTDQVVHGISLTWEVVEYSDAIQLPNQGERFMKRDVDDDGEPSSAQETCSELPDGLCPYTKEREEALRRLRRALVAVDARMVALFRGKPTHVGRALDEVSTGPLLLEAPKPKKSKS